MESHARGRNWLADCVLKRQSKAAMCSLQYEMQAGRVAESAQCVAPMAKCLKCN